MTCVCPHCARSPTQAIGEERTQLEFFMAGLSALLRGEAEALQLKLDDSHVSVTSNAGQTRVGTFFHWKLLHTCIGVWKQTVLKYPCCVARCSEA